MAKTCRHWWQIAYICHQTHPTMAKKVKISLRISGEDASILSQLAANDVRTLANYCESILVRAARERKHLVSLPPTTQHDDGESDNDYGL